MIKKLFYILMIAVSVGVVYVYRDKYIAFYDSLHPCTKPITWTVGTVDPRFNLTRDQFIANVKQAAAIWSQEEGKNLFVYDPEGKLSINLIFDQRQQSQNKINALDSQLENQKNKLSLDINSYRQQVTDFKARLDSYNKEVAKWNSQGGAPQDIFDKLNQEQKDLQAEANRLNATAKKLNLNSENYNLGVGNLNSEIQNFNQDLVQKPEEGIFMGPEDRIEIYFNNNKLELEHTLAHELGHAVGVDHNENPKSIMYPFTTQITKLSDDDKQALADTCRPRSIIDGIKARFQSNR